MVRVGCRALAVLAVTSFAVGACSSFSGGADTPEGGSADATTDTPDGGGADVIAPADASANLFANGDFELGCAGWVGVSATLTDDTEAHSGSRSCRVCANGTTTFIIQQRVSGRFAPGERYVVEAYVHAASDGGVLVTPLTLNVVLDSPAMMEIQSTSDTGPVPGAQWQRISGLIDVATDGGASLLTLVGSSDTGRCYLVDDARLYRP